jgi:hypothetical protein
VREGRREREKEKERDRDRDREIERERGREHPSLPHSVQVFCCIGRCSEGQVPGHDHQAGRKYRG